MESPRCARFPYPDNKEIYSLQLCAGKCLHEGAPIQEISSELRVRLESLLCHQVYMTNTALSWYDQQRVYIRPIPSVYGQHWMFAWPTPSVCLTNTECIWPTWVYAWLRAGVYDQHRDHIALLATTLQPILHISPTSKNNCNESNQQVCSEKVNRF